MAQNGEKDWIFYINILERASVSVQTQNRDRLLIGHVLNPLVFYLTREVPNQLIDERDVGGELQGGNIIRMLIPERLVTFQVTEDIDTPLVKGEVLREFETERYLDASEGQKEENW
jgi:hypothetical protein